MADFTALKTAIQTYIKQNGNEEITGNILQEVLLSMVQTMGDGAINDLVTALSNEVTARQNADGTLQNNINNEATTRGNADTALGGRIDGLQTAINGINTKLAEGYIYAGIATPSTNPGTPTGKVFYIAYLAGTYINFDNKNLTKGFNIIKYNGTVWSKDQVFGIVDQAEKDNGSPISSHGVFQAIKPFVLQKTTDDDLYDFSFADEKGNVLVGFPDGEIETKNFSSKNVLNDGYADTEADFSFVDKNGNVLAEFDKGSIRTKNFDPTSVGRLKGKNVLFLGDSITYYKEYVNSFVKITGCVAYNRGLGSSCISDGGTGVPASFCTRVDLAADNRQDGAGMSIGMPDLTMDMVIIEGGINDFGYACNGNKTANLGAMTPAVSASTKQSFYGAAKYVLNKMKTLYPNALIVVVGLIPTYSPVDFVSWSQVILTNDDPLGEITKRKTSENNSWFDYNAALEAVAKQFGAVFVSLENMGINPIIASDRTTYYKDGLHPNNAGGEKIAKEIIKTIANK